MFPAIPPGCRVCRASASTYNREDARITSCAVECEDFVGLVVGGQGDCHGVREIQTQVGIEPADGVGLLENVGSHHSDFEVLGTRLGGEIFDHLRGDARAEFPACDVVYLGENKGRQDHEPSLFEYPKGAVAVR
ncbi:hypothetical protein IFM12275_42410 [Nocardia sputorum]|nr:hypothetical protein IFM12275_42410 [Nocardia sputorum]